MRRYRQDPVLYRAGGVPGAVGAGPDGGPSGRRPVVR
ncbi:hypothetical protein [Sphingomonas oryzagri]